MAGKKLPGWLIPMAIIYVGFGIALGATIDNIALGLGIGIGILVIMYVAYRLTRKKKDTPSESSED